MIPVREISIDASDDDVRRFADSPELIAHLRKPQAGETCLLDVTGTPMANPPFVLVARLDSGRLVRLAVADAPGGQGIRRLLERIQAHFVGH